MHNPAFTPPPALTTRPDLQGTFGMVSSTHWLATATAQSVLERGGNAFDAIVAGAFVLHVVEPYQCGPGGDLVGIFATGSDPAHATVLMGQGPAPAGATIEHYKAEGLDLVPGAGALAAAIPAAVDAWLLLLRDYGTWSVGDVLAYAIHYARDGHPVCRATCREIAESAQLFTTHWPTSAARWLVGGRPPQPGEMIYNPAYAATFDKVAAAAKGATREAAIDAARDAWAGILGAAAEQFCRTPHWHSDGHEHAGVLTAADVAGFRASFEPAEWVPFRGHSVAKAGAWCQGPVLQQTLALLEPFDDAQLDPSTLAGAHTIIEAMKLAFADREAWYGDCGEPDTIARLLDPAYLAARRALIGDKASDQLRPGQLAGRPQPMLPPLREHYETPDGVVRADTCHIDVADRWGNVIAATPSGGWLQSSPTIPELGFCLGTRLQMSWLDAASPSRLEPGRRPRTTLTPTLVASGDRTMACGTPGGDYQDQIQLLFLLRVLVGGYTPQQAIDAPAFQTSALPSSFWPRTWRPAGVTAESRLGTDVINGLIRLGHRVDVTGAWSLGQMCTVTYDGASHIIGAAANSRGAQGYAAGR